MTRSQQKYLFLAIGIVLSLWTVYTQFFASEEALRMSDQYHIDKAMHFLGGVLLVGIARGYFGFSGMWAVFLVIAAGIGWELFELWFFPNVREFSVMRYEVWRSDMRGDVILDIAGGFASLVWYKEKWLTLL